jgi:hypothetical protein
MRLPVGPFPSPDPRKFQPLFLCWPGGILEQNHHADCHKLDFHNVFLVLSFNSTSRLADPPTVRKFIRILRVQTTLGVLGNGASTKECRADEGWPSSEVCCCGRAGLKGCLPSEGILSRNARLATCALGLDAAFGLTLFFSAR